MAGTEPVKTDEILYLSTIIIFRMIKALSIEKNTYQNTDRKGFRAS